VKRENLRNLIVARSAMGHRPELCGQLRRI
jgi:hypothetical protein